jgi:hypothetical protein
MEKAPWLHEKNSGRGWYSSHSTNQQLIWGFVTLLVILVILSYSFFPPVRAIARQVYFSFIRAPSNELEILVTDIGPSELFNFSDPENFTLTIDEANQQAGFIVSEIVPLPTNLKYIGSKYFTSYNAVISFYEGEDYKLYLSQRPIGNTLDVFSIGSEAMVNLVRVGNISGEYVTGGWKALTTQTSVDTPFPDGQTKLRATWDNSLPQSTLRWQSNGFVYELRSIGQDKLSAESLIYFANRLK